jgi:hypothetical protein
MNSKQRYDFNVSNGLVAPGIEETIIRDLAQSLIQALYRPSKDDGILKVDPSRIIQLCPGADDEPINWGSLSATVTKQENGTYLICIDEAAPDDCPCLCNYIAEHMDAWGWAVDVITQW